MDEPRTAATDPNPWRLALDVIREFDPQVADQSSLAERGERFVAAGSVRRHRSPSGNDRPRLRL
jgi:hypothetical protein